MDMLSVPQPSAGTREGFPAFRLKELAVSADLPMLWAGNPTDVIEQLDSPQDVASLFEPELGPARHKRAPSTDQLHHDKFANANGTAQKTKARKAPTPQVFTFAEAPSAQSRENCSACRGKHRAHTCGKLTRKIQKFGAQASHENNGSAALPGAASIRVRSSMKACDRASSSTAGVPPARTTLSTAPAPAPARVSSLTTWLSEGAPHHASRSYAMHRSAHGLLPPSNYPIPAESAWSRGTVREWLPNLANSNNAVVKSLSALSDHELRQALPPNYGDSQEEICTVKSIKYDWFHRELAGLRPHFPL